VLSADPIVGTYLHLLSIGTDEIRSALTPPGQAAGDIPFRVARRTLEPSLELEWPHVASGGSVEILNDSITLLQCAVSGFQDAFSIPHESAARLALRVHGEGAARVARPSAMALAAHCRGINAAWRARGYALYCRPSPLDADA
jgi:ATP-dependent Clp protease adapter protein ClpS